MAEAQIIDPTPKFTFDRGVAMVTWPDMPPFGISMLFRSIRTDRRSDEVHAEIQVHVGTNGAVGDQIHRGRLNLSSLRAQGETAKFLEHQVHGPDWPARLAQASWLVVDAQKVGRPPIVLRDTQAPPGGRYVLPPILLAAQPVILFGDGGMWKSYFALLAALSIHTGKEIVPGLVPTAKLNVAYVDFEWEPWPHKARMAALYGPDSQPDLLYVPAAAEGPLAHQVDRLRTIVRDRRIGYIVLDSVGMACDGPPEDAVVALAFFQALSRLEVGSLLLAHTNRSEDQGKPFGSTFWHNSARATWFMKKVQEAGTKAIDVALYNKKPANDGPKEMPIGLHVNFAVAPTVVTRQDLTAVVGLASGLSLKDQMLDAIGSGALSIKALALQLGKSEQVVRNEFLDWEGKAFKRLPGTPYLVTKLNQ